MRGSLHRRCPQWVQPARGTTQNCTAMVVNPPFQTMEQPPKQRGGDSKELQGPPLSQLFPHAPASTEDCIEGHLMCKVLARESCKVALPTGTHMGREAETEGPDICNSSKGREHKVAPSIAELQGPHWYLAHRMHRKPPYVIPQGWNHCCRIARTDVRQAGRRTYQHGALPSR